MSGPRIALPARSAPRAGPDLSVARLGLGAVRDAVPVTRPEIQVIFPRIGTAAPTCRSSETTFRSADPWVK
jgi:hypothetical protein